MPVAEWNDDERDTNFTVYHCKSEEYEYVSLWTILKEMQENQLNELYYSDVFLDNMYDDTASCYSYHESDYEDEEDKTNDNDTQEETLNDYIVDRFYNRFCYY